MSSTGNQGMIKRASAWRGKLAFILAGTVAGLMLVELGLRLISPVRTFDNPVRSFHQPDPNLGWTGRPNLKARFRMPDFDVMVEADAQGFRARKAMVHPETGSPVIAVLGDSFAWGWGVANGSVFTDVMQNELGGSWDVHNYGMNAYGTVQEWLLLRQLIAEGLRPAHVLVMFFNNDLYDNVDPAPWRPSMGVHGTSVVLRNHPVELRTGSRLKQLAGRSRLFSVVEHMVSFRRAKQHTRSLRERGFKEWALDQEPRQVLIHCARELEALCRQHGIELTFVYIPEFNDLHSSATASGALASRAALMEAGVHLVDLTGAFQLEARGNPARLYFPHDEHWNEAGHKLAGETLARHLMERIRAAPARQP